MKAYWSPSLVLLFFNIGVFCSIGQGIRIESAYYGPPNKTGVDVTRRVQRFADYGEPFRVGSDTLRIDPSPNHPKSLVVIYEVYGQRISDCVREGEVFYFRNGSESESNRDHGVRAFKSSGRFTVRETGTWMSRASFANWRETAGLSRCRMKHLVSILIKAGRNGSRSPYCAANCAAIKSIKKVLRSDSSRARYNRMEGRAYSLLAKASSCLRRSMTKVLLSPYKAHGPDGTS